MCEARNFFVQEGYQRGRAHILSELSIRIIQKKSIACTTKYKLQASSILIYVAQMQACTDESHEIINVKDPNKGTWEWVHR